MQLQDLGSIIFLTNGLFKYLVDVNYPNEIKDCYRSKKEILNLVFTGEKDWKKLVKKNSKLRYRVWRESLEK